MVKKLYIRSETKRVELDQENEALQKLQVYNFEKGKLPKSIDIGNVSIHLVKSNFVS